MKTSDIKWPKWLIMLPKPKASAVSPAAAFNPAAATSGEAWQSSSTPSQRPEFKTLVLDLHVFQDGIDIGKTQALIHYLQRHGVPVVLCVKTEHGKQFLPLKKGALCARWLKKLSVFDPDTDYKQLAKHEVARDKVATLTPWRGRRLVKLTHNNRWYLAPFSKEEESKKNPKQQAFYVGHCNAHIANAYGKKKVPRGHTGNSLRYANETPLVKKINLSTEDLSPDKISDIIKAHPLHLEQILQTLSERGLFSNEMIESLHSIGNLEKRLYPRIARFIHTHLTPEERPLAANYYIALKGVISTDEIPLERILKETGMYIFHVFDLLNAFPKLWKSFNEIISKGDDRLLENLQTQMRSPFSPVRDVFKNAPPSLLKTCLKMSPIRSLASLSLYLDCFPESIDFLIQENLSLLKANNLTLHHNDIASFSTGLSKIYTSQKEMRPSLRKLYFEVAERIKKEKPLLLPRFKDPRILFEDNEEKIEALFGSMKLNDMPLKNVNQNPVAIRFFSRKYRQKVINTLTKYSAMRLFPYLDPDNTGKISLLFSDLSDKEKLSDSSKDDLAILERLASYCTVEEAKILSKHTPYIRDNGGIFTPFYLPIHNKEQIKFNKELQVGLYESQVLAEDKNLELHHYDKHNLDVIFKHKAETKDAPDTFPGVTYLSIGLLSDDSPIEEWMARFPDLKYIRIDCHEASIEKAYTLLNACDSKRILLGVKQVSISEIPTRTGPIETGILSQFPELTHFYCDKIPPGREDKLKSYCAKNNILLNEPKETSATNNSSQEHIESQQRKHSSSVFIGEDLNEKIRMLESGKSHFNYHEAGKLLNAFGRKLHRFRMKITDLSDNLRKTVDCKAKLNEQELPPPISEELIKKKSETGGDSYCYYFSRKIPAHKEIRLPSADVNEQLLALSSSKKTDLTLYRGEDDFYYVKSNRATEISYLLEAPCFEASSIIQSAKAVDKLLTGKDKETQEIRQILKNYYTNPNYSPSSEFRKITKFGERTTAWLTRLYDEPGGSCAQRCFGVYYKIQQNASLKNRARLLDIDCTHVRLEIKNTEGKWIQIDLGGRSNATERYDKKKTVSDKLEGILQKETPEPLKHLKAPLSDSGAAKKALDSLVTKKKSIALISHPSEVFQKRAYPIRIVSQNTEQASLTFLESAKKNKKACFFLYDRSQLKGNKDALYLDTKKPTIAQRNPLYEFIKDNKNNPNAFLIIDWSAFSGAEKVRLNSYLDPDKDNRRPLKVIGICQSNKEDASFEGRYQGSYKLNPGLKKQKEPAKETMTLDLKGLSDWKASLFGKIILDNNQIIWKKLDLFKRLKSKNQPMQLILKNAPKEAISGIQTYLNLSIAQGYADYHGYHINMPEQLNIQIDPSDFDFTEFPETPCAIGAFSSQLPENVRLINSVLFDYLLSGKSIEDGVYSTQGGWLKEHAGKKLSLFVSSELTDTQWYCLMREATDRGVSLKVYCAPGVTPPKELKTQTIEPKEGMAVEQNPFVFICKDPKRASQKSPSGPSFPIEDYSYQDLVSATHYSKEEHSFSHFKEQESDIIEALKEGRDIQLYGDFSPFLLQSLEPILLDQATGSSPLKGTLKLFISKGSEANLSFLPKSCTESISDEAQRPPKETMLYQEKNYRTLLSLDRSKEKTDGFIDARLIYLKTAINEHPFVHLEGETGVGKTFIIKELEEQSPDRYKVYHELDHIEEWLQAAGNKTHLLFLDEANIRDMELTFLEPLANASQKSILYKGKIYELTDKHRVIFASNPISYGGGRKVQKLFKRNSIPKISLQALPNYVVYERMLKPLGPSKMPEPEFRAICESLIKEHHDSKNFKSARDLPEELELLLAKKVLSHQAPAESATDFILTPSLRPIQKDLEAAIYVRKNRRQRKNTSAPGKNIFLLEGPPGVGKSELVRFQLKHSGYQEFSSKERSEEKPCYVRLKASLPEDELKEHMRDVFNKGHVAWIDEYNSLPEEITQWCNAFASGLDPDTKQRAETGGFMIIGTCNGIHLEGRRTIDKSQRGRATTRSIKKPNQEDIAEIIKHKYPKLDGEKRATISQTLSDQVENDPAFSTREIIPKVAHLILQMDKEKIKDKKQALLAEASDLERKTKAIDKGSQNGQPRQDALIALGVTSATAGAILPFCFYATHTAFNALSGSAGGIAIMGGLVLATLVAAIVYKVTDDKASRRRSCFFNRAKALRKQADNGAKRPGDNSINT